MKSGLFKYFQIFFFILLLGWGLGRNTQAGSDFRFSENHSETETSLNNGDAGFEQMQIIQNLSALSVLPAESFRAESSGVWRDCFKGAHVYLKYVVKPFISHKSEFLHLLSSRHSRGFYVYTLEKLLI
jgi:hypothetical protein